MNRIYKTALVTLVIFCMSFTNVYAWSMQLEYDGKVHEYNLAPITLYINGEQIETEDMPPIQLEETTLVPVREVFEPMGAHVLWNDYEKRVYVSYGDKLIVLEVDSTEGWVNGVTTELSMPAKIINNKIMVPLRFIGEQMGFEVIWEGSTRSIYINEPVVEEPEEPEEVPDVPGIPEEPSEPNQPEFPEGDFDEILTMLEGVKQSYKGERGSVVNHITRETNDIVLVSSVEVSDTSDGAIVSIKADNKITDIEPIVLEDRLVIDIQNSLNGLSSSVTIPENSYVSGVRTSQYEEDVTRIVLDLKTTASAEILLTPDRQTIMVNLKPSPLSGVIVGQDVEGDYIYIDGTTVGGVDVTNDMLRNEVSIIIPNTYVGSNMLWEGLNGEYIQSVIITNRVEGVEIILNIDGIGVYVEQVISTLNGVMIRVLEPTYRNLEYRDGSLYIDKPAGLDVGDISVEDKYRERELVVDLGADYEWYYGYGKYRAEDSVIQSVEIETDLTTKITIDEKTVHAYEIRDWGNQIEIKLIKPKQKYDKIVVLDPGHGGTDPGASGNGLVEKDIVLEQALMVRDMLEENTDIKVYMARETDVYYTVPFRPELANEIEADLLVSFHANSFVNASANGVELYYFPDSTSGLNEEIANLFQQRIVDYTGLLDRGAKANSNLIVIRDSNMPAVLLECGFVSNPVDAAKLASWEFKEAYTRAVYECIVEIFDTMLIE